MKKLMVVVLVGLTVMMTGCGKEEKTEVAKLDPNPKILTETILTEEILTEEIEVEEIKVNPITVNEISVKPITVVSWEDNTTTWEDF